MKVFAAQTAALVAALCSFCTLSFAESLYVDGADTPIAKGHAAEQLRDYSYPASSTTNFSLAEVDETRIHRMLQNQDGTGPAHIGLGRSATSDSDQKFNGVLAWHVLGDGSATARLTVRSPTAHGLRVALVPSILPAGSELRFYGSGDPARIVGPVLPIEVARASSAESIYWSPITDGEAQSVEWYVPPHTSTNGLRLRVTAVSHLLTSIREHFVLPKAGCAGTVGPNCAAPCEIDAACTASPPAAYLAARDATIIMALALSNGDAYFCSGTVLNDSQTSFTPYVYSAAHCLHNSPNANTLNTIFFAASINCGGPYAGPANVAQLTSGADVLYSDVSSDVLFLKLRSPLPGGAHLSGWDARPLPDGTSLTIFHHPKGDGTKISLATADGVADNVHNEDTGGTLHGLEGVSFISGITENGSSGSGMLSKDVNGAYFLRGGLFGGPATLTCGVVGLPPQSGNLAFFSRLDLAFPHIQQWLAPSTSAFAIEPGISGSWFNPSQNGHGFEIEVLPNNQMLLFWFVYGPNGGRDWVVASGAYSGGVATLTAFQSGGTGGLFPPRFDGSHVSSFPWGTFTLTFSDCTHGHVEYVSTVPGYSAGGLDIARLTLPQGLACS